MFFKVMATFLKIVLFDLKRYCIWFEDALYVAGTFCATCFFLPEVLYLVRSEMGAYLHVGKKHYLIEMKRYIFKRSGFLHRNATYWKGILFCLREATPFEWKCLFVKPACQLELVLQEKDACLIVSCSHLQCFHCLFQVWGKDPKLKYFFFKKCGLNHYLRETLQRGGGTTRHVNYT